MKIIYHLCSPFVARDIECRQQQPKTAARQLEFVEFYLGALLLAHQPKKKKQTHLLSLENAFMEA